MPKDDYNDITLGQMMKLSGFDRAIKRVSKLVLDMPVRITKDKIKDMMKAMETLRQYDLKLAIEEMEEVDDQRLQAQRRAAQQQLDEDLALKPGDPTRQQRWRLARDKRVAKREAMIANKIDQESQR